MIEVALIFALAQPIRVIDGDSYIHNGQRYRLLMVDAVEKSQPFGTEAKNELISILKRNPKEITKKKDLYGRNLVILSKNNRNLNILLVEKGLAYVYYTKDKAFLAAEKSAKDKKLGLWSQPNPIPPWEYRKQQRLKK